MNSLQRIGSMSIGEMRKINEEYGGSWFGKSEMKFFGIVVHGRSNVYGEFITAETDFNDDTRFTVRRIDITTGNIETVGEFGQFETFADARKYRSKFGRKHSS